MYGAELEGRAKFCPAAILDTPMRDIRLTFWDREAPLWMWLISGAVCGWLAGLVVVVVGSVVLR